MLKPICGIRDPLHSDPTLVEVTAVTMNQELVVARHELDGWSCQMNEFNVDVDVLEGSWPVVTGLRRGISDVLFCQPVSSSDAIPYLSFGTFLSFFHLRIHANIDHRFLSPIRKL